MAYLIGIDVGGTFTDCVVVGGDGRVALAKAETTPSDLTEGCFNALRLAAGQVDEANGLSSVSSLRLGTTVATNAMIERRGATVGLITTKGHRDAIQIMRAAGRTAGLPDSAILHISQLYKPEPIVPRWLTEEVSERLDYQGEVVVPLNEDDAREAARRLIEGGVQAIAICFLWSFLNPEHERRTRDIIREISEDIPISCSGELLPRIGEYERMAGTVINSYLMPLVRSHLHAMERRLKENGGTTTFLVMQSGGGLIDASEAAEAPVLLLHSGPVGGIAASEQLGALKGHANIIATDMGGTSFDVGLIVGGRPIKAATDVSSQYEFYVPHIDVTSLGAGGGSVIWWEEISGTLKVGPMSAGARPGPACYGRDGVQPTITDADLVLGILNPEYFLGGALTLRPELARRALEEVGRPLSMTALEVASGAARIVDAQMGDLLRQTTLGQGLDPRDFVLYAYGGAGPVHAAAYAGELGIKEVVVPMGDLGSLWSAFGVASSDLIRIHEQSRVFVAPFAANEVGQELAKLEQRARAGLEAKGVSEDNIELRRFADMRFRAQMHVVDVPLPSGDLSEDFWAGLPTEFERHYEALYGSGSAYPAAGTELITLRVEARGVVPKPPIAAAPLGSERPSEAAEGSPRDVFWYEVGRALSTRVLRGPFLIPGNRFEGPAVVEFPDTTVVVQPGQQGYVDEYGNIIIGL